MEAIFESNRPQIGNIIYPFSSHWQEKRGKGVMANAHWHYYIEILFCLTGKARAFINGEGYDFQKGDMVLINSRDVHSVYSYAENAQVGYIVVKIHPEVLYTTSKTIFESKYVLPFTMAKAKHQKVFLDKEIAETPIPTLIKEILKEYTERTFGFELAIRTHICRIFLWVLRNWQEKGLNHDVSYILKENDIERLQKAFDYLDHNYQNNITAESVAKVCNMSYSYFSRFFKAAIGKTFTEYLNYVRIVEAEKLLLSTDKNITEIAQETGFSTSSYFIQQFKHFKNISPKRFKKKLIESIVQKK